MAGRTRTAKALAQRIDLNYFKRPHPFRRLKMILSIAVPAAVLLWLGGNAAGKSKAPYSSGPVAPSHQVFGDKCERCHVTQVRAFRAHVTDNMCVSCHDAPQHKSNQTFTPTCASCHVEHRGAVRLAATADRDCAQCHRDLNTTTGRLTVAKSVGTFNGAHPEFGSKRDNAKDPAVLKFNHEVHMKADLRGPKGTTQLECATCHTPAANAPIAARARATDSMSPVTYARDCASCHPLFFDPLIDAVAPHDTPEKVHAMVTQSLREFIAANPAQIGRPDPVRRPHSGELPRADAARAQRRRVGRGADRRASSGCCGRRPAPSATRSSIVHRPASIVGRVLPMTYVGRVLLFKTRHSRKSSPPTSLPAGCRARGSITPRINSPAARRAMQRRRVVLHRMC